jgi:ATP-binding cassette subfamily C protein
MSQLKGLGLRKAVGLSWGLLKKKEKWLVVFLGIGMSVEGMLEVFSLAAFIPFIGLMLDPVSLQTNKYLSFLYNFMQRPPAHIFFIWIGSGFFLLILLQNLFKNFYNFFQNKLVADVEKRVAVELFQKYLYAPYVWFLSRNTSDLLKEIMGDVTVWARSCLKSFLSMASNAITILSLLAFMVILNPLVGSILVIAGIVITILTLSSMRPYIRRAAKTKERAIGDAYKVVTHALVGSKDVKISGREAFFVNQFSRYFQMITQITAKVATINPIPSSIIEIGVAFALVIIGFHLSGNPALRSGELTLLTVYGIGAIRLLPLFSNITSTVTAIQGAVPAIECIEQTNEQLRQLVLSIPAKTEESIIPHTWDALTIENVTYYYPNSHREALKGVSFQVRRGMKLGIVGRSGAGKSTLVDIITGLLTPTHGSFLIGNIVLHEKNVRGWQRQIGYVPQAPFIADDSLKFNVALCVEDAHIDEQRVMQALEAAHLDDMVRKELPKGLDTLLGDRGVRLSGGQRQRVSIARALYHNPALLILDEATNALDTESEHIIMQSLDELSGAKTIIIVAHRLSTVRNCNMIIVLDRGKIIDCGDHRTLIERCNFYRDLVKLSDISAPEPNVGELL